jgi:hypothetical protein
MIKSAWHWVNDTYKGSLFKSVLLSFCALLWIVFLIWFLFSFSRQYKDDVTITMIAMFLPMFSAPIILASVGFSYVNFVDYRTWRDIHSGKITDYRQLLHK